MSRRLGDSPRPGGFALALALLILSGAAFGVVLDQAFAVMCAMCLAGLAVAQWAGASRHTLTVLAIGFVVSLWLVGLLNPVGPEGTASVLAHLLAAALLGWAVARAWVRRQPESSTAALVVAVTGIVLVIGLVWEGGEAFADQLLDTDLAPGAAETATDLAADMAGAIAGAWYVSRRR